MLSCQPVNKDNVSVAADTLSDDRGGDLQQNIKRNVVRTTLIDSLKWVMYTFNYESQAISEETGIAVSPLALVGSHITSDPIPDRIFLSHEALFSKYLKKYKDEINAWLENEAIKRKVLE